jgi:hypothetical protein
MWNHGHLINAITTIWRSFCTRNILESFPRGWEEVKVGWLTSFEISSLSFYRTSNSTCRTRTFPMSLTPFSQDGSRTRNLTLFARIRWRKWCDGKQVITFVGSLEKYPHHDGRNVLLFLEELPSFYVDLCDYWTRQFLLGILRLVEQNAIETQIKIRDLIVVCIFVANKAYETAKWKKLETIL